MKDTIAREPFSGSANATVTFNGEREELFIINDGAADVTFATKFFTFTLKPGEYFDERIDPFSSVMITATGAFRGYVREAR